MAGFKADPGPCAFAGTEGIYHLPHHAKEIERLQQQHAFIRSSTGSILITAPIEGKNVIRVLDSGAADGTWLRDIARLYPQQTWKLHGVDIGPALFPSRTGENKNLDLQELDVRVPAPARLEWTNSFDLVHQRLLIWALRGPDWQRVLRNHYEILKPNGWIQLVEGRWVDREHSFDTQKSPALAKMTKLQKWTTAAFGMDIYVAYELEGLLRRAGFVNISTRTFELGYGAKAKDLGWRSKSTDMWIDTFRAFAHKMPEEGISGVAQNMEAYQTFLDDLRIEVQEQGYAPVLEYVVGQKPRG